MNAKKIRWGILGAARINRSLVPAVQASRRSELAAIASRDISRAQDQAQQWGIPRAYASYDEVLADPDVDVIYNPLPNHLHAEWSIRAAQAGKHVLCEKPLALTTAEVDAMAKAAQQYGVVIAEAFMYRHHPQTLKVQELVQSGALGEIRLIHGTFSFLLDRPQDPRWLAEMGGGSIWDIGCYPISYTQMLTGSKPEEVFGWQQTASSGADETFSGQMRCANGVFASFDCSFRLPLHTGMLIRGSQATLTIPTPFSPRQKSTLILQPIGGDEKRITIPTSNLYLGEVEDMAACILDGKTQRVTLEESRQHIETICALLESARIGRPVRLS